MAERIMERVPVERRPGTSTDLSLFRIYAVLAYAKGDKVTAEDVHDAWCAWTADKENSHPALVRFGDLDPETKDLDEIFVNAIQMAFPA
jgi:hypothetical protein